MKPNVGRADKSVRLVLSALFIYLGYKYINLFYLVSLILLFAVFTNHCLIYDLFKINTAEKKRGKK